MSRSVLIMSLTALLLSARIAPATTGHVTVHVYNLDDRKSDKVGKPAGSGVFVKVDGSVAGLTNSKGVLEIDLPPGQHRVEAVVPSKSMGWADITLGDGQSTTLELVLDDGKDVVEPTTLEAAEIPNGVLPYSFQTLSMRFVNEGETVKLKTLEAVDLTDASGTPFVRMGTLFRVTENGGIKATKPNKIRNYVLNGLAAGASGIRVVGVDADGFTHENTIAYRLGILDLDVALKAPPSLPSLDLAGLPLSIEVLGTDTVYQVVTDQAGTLTLKDVPMGVLAFRGVTEAGGVFYYASGIADDIWGSIAVTLTMRSVTDIKAGVRAISVEYVAGPEESHPIPRPATRQPSAPGRNGALVPGGDGEDTVTVASGPEGAMMEEMLDIPLKKGTKTVTLKYEVCSDEYPEYVLPQSEFNDAWAVEVYANLTGATLFSKSMNVNSQLWSAPTWRGDGCTGDVTTTLNVEALTKKADTSLTMLVRSMNVSDELLPTYVMAGLSHVDIDIDFVSISDNRSHISVPRSGLNNTNQVTMDIKATKPKDARFTKIKVTLLGEGGDLQVLIDQAGVGGSVVDRGNDILRVTVTMSQRASAVNTDPPPTGALRYKFRIDVKRKTDESYDEEEFSGYTGLWGMPQTVARYGVRDPGGDDWAKRETYRWLQNNAGLITRVDDISGEHGMNIGHQTHDRGVDIDMFHYYTLPGGAASGGANYDLLRQAVVDAIGGNQAQAQQVSAWITTSRASLASLVANNAVGYVYYAIGSAAGILPDGWARDLLTRGRVTPTVGDEYDTGLGNWNRQTITYNAVHNSHIHIHLNY